MTYFSQHGEDKWIQENLNPPDASRFCEVGAFDGLVGSNTLYFERKGWTGLLIEPNPKQWEKCRVNRKVPSICIAVGSPTEVGDRPFYINPSDEGLSGLIVAGNPIMQFCTTLESLWGCFFEAPPYLLSIDTEGTELRVWAGAFRLRPEIVIMEHLTLGYPSKYDETKAVMEASDYKLVHTTDCNMIFVRK